MPPSTTSDGRPLIAVEGLTVQFGGLTALKNVSTQVARGEIRGIIGPNGAGKTTFFNAVTRFVPLKAGQVFFDGEDITHRKPHEIAELGIIRTFQKRATIGNLTALENVLTGCHRLMRDVTLWDIAVRSKRFCRSEGEAIRMAHEALEVVGIPGVADQQASELSFGQQTLVEIARALVSKPTLLLLDEPAAGLSAKEHEQVTQVLRSLPARHGVALIITDHVIDFVMEVCEKLTVLNFGEKLEEGDAAYIRNHPGVLEAYFGRG
ncbi:MAG TPA: ABC transporter ATP-binding protein [Candidatus Sulfotelmatobacter sp.]|nr:ABC transporter ATP-binding protein [Candidatus Sulfotelmatobacter sp.]